jgi:hypothetical protein
VVTGEGYIHGPVNCRACFRGNEESIDLDSWRLQNNPGYYGSSDPKILVLGFSKGLNQARAAEAGSFDKIAFAGARPRLRAVLETLGLMSVDRDIDAIMTRSERDFGVASLVRCSFSKLKNGVYKTSGDVIPSSFSNPETLGIIRTCAERYLRHLPARVRLVILLGTGDVYIAKTKALFQDLYPSFHDENPVAFRTDKVLWIYAAHPSPGNGHFDAWARGSASTKSGRKRELSLLALRALQGR